MGVDLDADARREVLRRCSAQTCSAQKVMALKASVCLRMPTSVGRRSMDEAPKNPTMPSVLARTYCASAGSAIGPPWHRTRMSGLTFLAASASAWTFLAASSSVSAVGAPMVPAVVRPMCGTRMSAPAPVSYTHLRAHETRHDL